MVPADFFIVTNGDQLCDVRTTSHVCKPINDLRWSPVASTSDRRFSHLYTGRKIYGPLNDSTEFNCHFIMVYV